MRRVEYGRLDQLLRRGHRSRYASLVECTVRKTIIDVCTARHIAFLKRSTVTKCTLCWPRVLCSMFDDVRPERDYDFSARAFAFIRRARPRDADYDRLRATLCYGRASDLLLSDSALSRFCLHLQLLAGNVRARRLLSCAARECIALSPNRTEWSARRGQKSGEDRDGERRDDEDERKEGSARQNSTRKARTTELQKRRRKQRLANSCERRAVS